MASRIGTTSPGARQITTPTRFGTSPTAFGAPSPRGHVAAPTSTGRADSMYERPLGCAEPFILNTHFWMYALVAALFGLLSWKAIQDRQGLWDGLPKPNWALPLNGILALYGVHLAIQAFVGFEAAQHASEATRTMLNLAFVLQSTFSLLWAYTFFVKQDMRMSAYIGAAAVLVGLWSMWLVWKENRTLGYFQVISVAFLAYLTFLNFQIARATQPGGPIPALAPGADLNNPVAPAPSA